MCGGLPRFQDLAKVALSGLGLSNQVTNSFRSSVAGIEFLERITKELDAI